MAKPTNGPTPVITARYYFKKETPGTWVYDLRGPDGKVLGSLYLPKSLVVVQPGKELRADFFMIK